MENNQPNTQNLGRDVGASDKKDVSNKTALDKLAYVEQLIAANADSQDKESRAQEMMDVIDQRLQKIEEMLGIGNEQESQESDSGAALMSPQAQKENIKNEFMQNLGNSMEGMGSQQQPPQMQMQR